MKTISHSVNCMRRTVNGIVAAESVSIKIRNHEKCNNIEKKKKNKLQINYNVNNNNHRMDAMWLRWHVVNTMWREVSTSDRMWHVALWHIIASSASTSVAAHCARFVCIFRHWELNIFHREQFLCLLPHFAQHQKRIVLSLHYSLLMLADEW